MEPSGADFKRVMRFWSISCEECGGVQLGSDGEGNQFIPIFHSPMLAEMAVEQWREGPRGGEFDAHPPVIKEFKLEML